MSHNYHFKRGDAVRILWGRYARLEGIIDSAVFQKTVDYPDDYAAGYHVVLEGDKVVTVRWDQVEFRRLPNEWKPWLICWVHSV